MKFLGVVVYFFTVINYDANLIIQSYRITSRDTHYFFHILINLLGYKLCHCFDYIDKLVYTNKVEAI